MPSTRILLVLGYAGLSVFACGLPFGFSAPRVPTGEPGNVENVSGDNQEMNVAIARAQETLPLFIAALDSPSSSQMLFSIKARFPYGLDDSAEHVM